MKEKKKKKNGRGKEELSCELRLGHLHYVVILAQIITMLAFSFLVGYIFCWT